MSHSIRIVVSDLDGTLLPKQGAISPIDKQTLRELKKRNIIRVIATGRMLYSALSVLPEDFPIDYLIFSSGAGIMNWQTKEVIYSQKLKAEEVSQISKVLMEHEFDFMVLDPIPQNHLFWYFQTEKANPDFSRRLSLYKEFATPIGSPKDTCREASQLLIILPNNIVLFEELKEKFTDIKIIRATSPLDYESIWMEIFPEHISKGLSCEWLCKKLNIPKTQSLAIGNDYNDIDLLEWSQHSFVMANAPKELRNRYHQSASDRENGFTTAVEKVLGGL